MILLPPTTHDDNTLRQGPLSEVQERATKVVLDAIKLQDTIQGVFISCDYFLFFPEIYARCSPDKMELVDPKPDATQALPQASTINIVLLHFTPGLGARRIEPNRSRSDVVVEKATVVVFP